MVRSSATVLLVVAALLAGGCKKKDEGAQSTGGEGAGGGAAATAAAATAAGGGGGAAVDWEKIERVPFAKLQTLLPESLLDMKRTDLAGRTVPGAADTYTEASARYEGPNDAYLDVTIHDNPTSAKDSISSKTSTFKGHPVTVEQENSDSADLTFIVGERFIVNAHGGGVKVAQIKTAFEKVDLATLASWKNAGLK